MTILNEVKLYAETMELGETARIVCPHCGGGSTKERSLTITLFDDMTVKYQCFRGMCSSVRGSFKLINTNINKDYETTTSLVPLNSKDKEKDKLFNGIVTELTKYEKALIRNMGDVWQCLYDLLDTLIEGGS